ncbi:unnamed protein product [Menidia menidia]|uniref:(Atlantic silverside) hypothetical protein n=1 Tax=Menidia menidia TaxID=238744 RepID=A0A8S4BXA8_9TELE|nr:unnamed protein product [Menidia menidia]
MWAGLDDQAPPSRRMQRDVLAEVRAALNPKDFFSETQTHNSSVFNSWVNPQFDRSVAAGPPLRRGRKKGLSASSILDGCSQLSRKNSVCKYPSLSFQTGSRDRPHKPKSTRSNKGAECTVGSNIKDQPQESYKNKRTVSSAQSRDTQGREFSSIRKGNVEPFSDVPMPCSQRLERPKIAPAEVIRGCRIPADGTSTPASNECSDTEVSPGPPPDVDTPKIRHDGSSCPSSPSVHLLLAQPCTPPSNQPPHILVADTPERDYGIKVTWRRRMGLMFMLKERGHLSESDWLIH